MEKKFKFPLHLQLFADTKDEPDENEEDTEIDEEDFEEEDVDEESEQQDPTDSDTTKKKQSQEENARQAQRRREKEQKEKASREEQIYKEAYEKGKLDATKVNPFTNKPIEDQYDLKIYELQKKIKDEGGDPIEDLPSELAKLEREETRRQAEAAKAKAQEDENILKDITNFKSKYKDVDVKALLNDSLFEKFSNGKLGGKNSLIKVYEDFLAFTELVASSKKEDEERKKKEEEAKKRGVAPSPNGGQTKNEQTSYSKLSSKEKIERLRAQGLIR